MIFRNGRFNIITIQNLVGIFKIFIFPKILSSRDSTIGDTGGYSCSSSRVITSRWFATSRLVAPVSVRLVYCRHQQSETSDYCACSSAAHTNDPLGSTPCIFGTGTRRKTSGVVPRAPENWTLKDRGKKWNLGPKNLIMVGLISQKIGLVLVGEKKYSQKSCSVIIRSKKGVKTVAHITQHRRNASARSQ